MNDEEEDLEAILLRDLAELDNPSVYADPRYTSYGTYGDDTLVEPSAAAGSRLLQLTTPPNASNSVLTMVANALQEASESRTQNKKDNNLSDAWTTYLQEIQLSQHYIQEVQQSAVQLNNPLAQSTDYSWSTSLRTSPILTSDTVSVTNNSNPSESKLNENENRSPIRTFASSPPQSDATTNGTPSMSFADYYMPSNTSLAVTAAAIAASVLKDDKEALHAINAAVQHTTSISTPSLPQPKEERLTVSSSPPTSSSNPSTILSPPKPTVIDKSKLHSPSSHNRPTTPLSSPSSGLSSPSHPSSSQQSAIAIERARVISETESLRSRPSTASRDNPPTHRIPPSVSTVSSPPLRASPSKPSISSVVAPYSIVTSNPLPSKVDTDPSPSITFDVDFQALQQQLTEQANIVLAQEREYRRKEMELQRLQIKEEEEKLENQRKALEEAAAFEAYRREVEKAKAAEATALRIANNAANRLQAVAKGFIIRRRTKLHILIETARQEKARQEAERQQREREAREAALRAKMEEEARLEAERARQAIMEAQAAEAARLEALRKAEEERRRREEEAIRHAAELAYQRQLAAEAAESLRKQQEMERKEKELRDRALELQRMNEEDQVLHRLNSKWREEYRQRKERFACAQEDYVSYQVRLRWKKDAEEKNRKRIQQRDNDRSSMEKEDTLSNIAERTYRLEQIFGGGNLSKSGQIHQESGIYTSPKRSDRSPNHLPPSPIQAWRDTNTVGNTNSNTNLIGNIRTRIQLAQQSGLHSYTTGRNTSPVSPSKSNRTSTDSSSSLLNFSRPRRNHKTSSSSIASKLQAMWKGKQERKNPLNPYNQYKQYIIHQQLQELHYLATRIQCTYRGYRVRKAVKAALEQARYQDTDMFQYNEIDLNEFLGPIPDDLLEPEKFPTNVNLPKFPGPPPPYMMGSGSIPLPPTYPIAPHSSYPPTYVPPYSGHHPPPPGAYRPGMLAVAMERQSQSQEGSVKATFTTLPSPPRFSPLVPVSHPTQYSLLPHHQRPLTGTSILTESLPDTETTNHHNSSNYPLPDTRGSTKSHGANDDNDTWELQSVRSDTGQRASTRSPFDRPPTVQSLSVSPTLSTHGRFSHIPSVATNNGLTKIPPMNPMAVAAVEAEWGVTDPHIAELILRRKHKIHHASKMGSKVQFRALEKAARSAAALAGHGGVIVGTGGFSYPTTTTSASQSMLPANSSFVDRIRGTVHGGRHNHPSSHHGNNSTSSSMYGAHHVTSTGMKMSRLPSVQDNLPDHLRPGGR